MPELPEVETIVRGLRATIVGDTIVKVYVNAPPASIYVSDSFNPKDFACILRGKKILSVTRRGKNILIHLSDSATLWVHLKMTGHFFYLKKTDPVDKHDLIIFDFESTLRKKQGWHLRFNDPRRFGRHRLFYDYELEGRVGLADLGPEPLEITASEFVDLCKKRRRMIKPALLDQTFLAGLGNIYSDEALYYSKIHPKRETSSLSTKKLVELHGNIQKILKRAIRLMGTSVDSYTGINGQSGQFQKYLRAYNNEGNPCDFCGTKIVRQRIGSRSTHFCPRCQRLR
ncbi:MAG: DNA-formamidopyrimidine glycosylase [Candidatus Zixiibacteriota bacterium]